MPEEVIAVSAGTRPAHALGLQQELTRFSLSVHIHLLVLHHLFPVAQYGILYCLLLWALRCAVEFALVLRKVRASRPRVDLATAAAECAQAPYLFSSPRHRKLKDGVSCSGLAPSACIHECSRDRPRMKKHQTRSSPRRRVLRVLFADACTAQCAPSVPYASSLIL